IQLLIHLTHRQLACPHLLALALQATALRLVMEDAHRSHQVSRLIAKRRGAGMYVYLTAIQHAQPHISRIGIGYQSLQDADKRPFLRRESLPLVVVSLVENRPAMCRNLVIVRWGGVQPKNA